VIKTSLTVTTSKAKPGDARAIDLLMTLAKAAQCFQSADGRFHVRVGLGGCDEILEVRSRAFHDWLLDAYLKEFHALPPRWVVNRVLDALEAGARFAVDKPTVHVRVGRGLGGNKSCYYLDLGDASGTAVEIGAGGWSVVDRPPVHFRRPEGSLPLPEPSHEGSIELLQPFVNLGEPEFRLLIGWMASALRPMASYPVLSIHGERGSSKSTLAQIVRKLIDPQSVPFLWVPRSARELMITAAGGWLLTIDNVSTLPDWLSNGLCSLATGGGIAGRMPFTTDESNVIYAVRPVVLNGIDEFVGRDDLADMSVFLNLPPISPSRRRTEDEFWTQFDRQYPRILGGLLNAVAGALRELPSVKLMELPPMADFAFFGEAIGRALGWPAGAFISAYDNNRRGTSARALEESLLGTALIKMIEWGEPETWTGSPQELLDLLARWVSPCEAQAGKQWPRTPAMLANELRRLAPELRTRGIDILFRRTSTSRLITVQARGD